MLRRLGEGHGFGDGVDARLEGDLAEFERLLNYVDLAPFRRLRRRRRVPEFVLTKIFQAINAYLDAEASDPAALAKRAAAQEARGAGKTSAAASLSESDLAEQELVLLDLLHAPEGSYLHSLAQVMPLDDLLAVF